MTITIIIILAFAIAFLLVKWHPALARRPRPCWGACVSEKWTGRWKEPGDPQTFVVVNSSSFESAASMVPQLGHPCRGRLDLVISGISMSLMRAKTMFVSFYTPEYANHAQGLIESLDQFGLDHDIHRIESNGSWLKNCAAKPRFVRDMLDRHRRPVVWVDADARIRQRPTLFDELACDVAAHLRDGQELLSGTLYFADTPQARKILDEWAAWQAISPSQEDQRMFEKAIEVYGWLINFAELPASYCQIFDMMAHHGQPVIEHLQASRSLRARTDHLGMLSHCKATR